MTTALEGGEGSASRPGRAFPSGKTRYPLYRRLGGPQGRSGQVRKISPLPEFDLRNIQPVASRYTDYATRPKMKYNVWKILISFMFLPRGAVFRESFRSKEYSPIQYNSDMPDGIILYWIVFLRSERLPGDCTSVPKHLGD